MVKREHKRRNRDYAMPMILLSIHYLLYSPLYILDILTYRAYTNGDYDRGIEFSAIVDSIDKHAVVLTGLDSLVLLVMVASIMQLVEYQKLYILAPTALYLFEFIIARFILQCINGNT